VPITSMSSRLLKCPGNASLSIVHYNQLVRGWVSATECELALHVPQDVHEVGTIA